MDQIDCKQLTSLARRLMNQFLEREDLVARQSGCEKLEAANADLSKTNAAITIHRLQCPICRAVDGTQPAGSQLSSSGRPAVNLLGKAKPATS
jgi:hypothetical protein